jgi:hypothetical protein
MSSTERGDMMTRPIHGIFLLALCVSAVPPVFAAPTVTTRTVVSDVHQKTFRTPGQAVSSLIAANRNGETRALLAILGPEGAKLIVSGDPVADQYGQARFVAAYDDSHTLAFNGQGKAVLVVGKEQWPFPVPLIRTPAGWRFDTAAGEEEILDRRIGRNEFSAIETCRIYVTAQRKYAATVQRTGGGPHTYARQFMSTAGTHDGLYWPAGPGDEESPLGPLIANARAGGYVDNPHQKLEPYHGYYFRILSRQGPDAPGGARNYVVDGQMTGGFALVAYPATYGDSGVMTFVASMDGIVYQKNLGPKTANVASQITQYDPDVSWQAVQENPSAPAN